MDNFEASSPATGAGGSSSFGEGEVLVLEGGYWIDVAYARSLHANGESLYFKQSEWERPRYRLIVECLPGGRVRAVPCEKDGSRPAAQEDVRQEAMSR
jgi:hypothetical protein